MSKKKKLFEKKKRSVIDAKRKFTAGSVYTTLLIIAVLCFIAGYFIAGSGGGTDIFVVDNSGQKSGVDVIDTGNLPSTVTNQTVHEDYIYYIISEGCTSCDSLKSVASDIASTLGVGLTVIEYTQSMSIPGYVLIYNNKLSINGVDSEYSFEQSVCDLTKNGDICAMAAEDKPAEPETPPAPEVPKTDKPKVEVFIMSYCPYGLQMEKAVVPVMETLGDKADIKIKFVNYLMHGENERDENTRQYCIQKEQKDKFTDYFRCFAPEGDWEGCLDEVGIDKAKLDACIEATNTEFNIMEDFANPAGNYPRYGVYDTDNTNYGVRGSPTTVINGVVASVSRSQQAVLAAVCAAFNNPPAECNTKLSTTAEQPSLGAVGAGDGSASGGQC